MVDKSRWKSVTDRGKWTARGASFVAKAKATKAVWLTPTPVATSKKAASAGKTSTKGATSAAKTTANRTRNVTKPVRRKKA